MSLQSMNARDPHRGPSQRPVTSCPVCVESSFCPRLFPSSVIPIKYFVPTSQLTSYTRVLTRLRIPRSSARGSPAPRTGPRPRRARPAPAPCQSNFPDARARDESARAVGARAPPSRVVTSATRSGAAGPGANRAMLIPLPSRRGPVSWALIPVRPSSC